MANTDRNTMNGHHIDHYLETIHALDRGDTATALVHATLAGHAAIADAINRADGVNGIPVYPAIIRTDAGTR